MPYDKGPPAPIRWMPDGTEVKPEPVAFRWPTIAALVTQDTAPVSYFQPDPTNVNL